MIAAQSGNEAIASLLLDYDANVDAVDEDEQTALMIPARMDHVDVALLLLDRNANANATNADEWTALMIAV